MTCKPRTTRIPSQGFSLVETIIATLIVAGLFTAALSAVTAARTTQIRTTDRIAGQLLAEELMAEILAQPYHHDDAPLLADADASQASTRKSFDAIADYHQWQSSPPQTSDGQTIPGYERWSRHVHIDYIFPIDPSSISPTPTGGKLITVSVYRDQLLVAELSAVRTDAWREPAPGDHHRLP